MLQFTGERELGIELEVSADGNSVFIHLLINRFLKKALPKAQFSRS